MNFGSLFAGIGGMDLGLERAGMTCKWQVEIDDYATRVLAKHWPTVPRYRDVRDVGSHNLESVDLICGGFPCQDISNAGKRAGIDGERSGLWSEYFRIICELRPRYVLVENVAALLARGLGRVLGDLAEGGYDAEWQCLPAAAFGAPHRRDRLFIVAYPASGNDTRGKVHAGNKFQALDRRATGSLITSSEGRPNVAHAERGRLQGGVFQRAQPPTEFLAPLRRDRYGFTYGAMWESEPAVGLLAHGVPSLVDQLRGLGNAVVPQVAEWIGKQILNADERPQTIDERSQKAIGDASMEPADVDFPGENGNGRERNE